MWKKEQVGIKLNKTQRRKHSLKKIFLVLLAIVLVVLIFFNVKDFVLKKLYPKKYNEYVEQYAKEYNLNENIIPIQ